MEDKTPEEVYEECWRPILEKDGKLDMDQLKKELSDFLMVMEMVSKVYDEVTGGRVSNPLVIPQQVITAYEEHIEETVEEGVLERRMDKALKRYFLEKAKEITKVNMNKELKEGKCSKCGKPGIKFVQKRADGKTDVFIHCDYCGWFALYKSTPPEVKKPGTTIDEDLMNALID